MNFGNLGIALGAFTDEQKAQAEEARKAKQFAQQEKDWRRQDEVDERLQKAHDFYNSGLQAIEKGEIGAFAPRAVDYLNSTDYMGKAKGAYLQGADGKHYVTYHDGNAYGPPQTHEITPEMARSALAEMYQHQLAAADPRQAFANNNAMETMGLRRKEVGFKGQEVADKGAYQRGIVDWHNRQADRPHFMRDGTDRVMAISPDGRLLGTYGSARPDHTGAQMALTNQLLEANKALNVKFAPLFEQAEKDVAAAYATNDPTKIRAAQAQAQLLNNSYQREMATKNPTAGGLRLNLPTEPNQKGHGLTALGSTGMLTDGEGIYALGNDGKSLLPVEKPAKPGAYSMPDPNAKRAAATAAELGGLSDTALGLRASAGDRAAAAEIQRRAQAAADEDRLSRQGLR